MPTSGRNDYSKSLSIVIPAQAGIHYWMTFEIIWKASQYGFPPARE